MTETQRVRYGQELGPPSKKREGEFWNTYGKLRNVGERRGYDGRYAYVVASKIMRGSR